MKLCAIAGIIPVIARNDKRVRMLTQEQLDMLRGLRLDAPIRQAPSADQWDMLARRVEALEREIVALKRQRISQGESTVSSTEARASVSERQAQPNQLGYGKNNAARLAVEHGVHSEKSAKDWSWGDSLANESGVMQFIQTYLAGHPRAGTFHECDRSECPCHSLQNP